MARRRKIQSSFGENLARIAKERRLKNRELAAAAGVPVSVVHNWLGPSGTIPHDLRAVARLSRYLGVRFDLLLLGETVEVESPLAAQFEEGAGEPIRGYYRIVEARKLVPRNRK